MVDNILIPAIDICNGAFVRLKRGNYSNITTFSKSRLISNILDINPYLVHIVDLDGARYGSPINSVLIQSLVRMFTFLGIRTQIGGGIRDISSIIKYVLLGSSIILGTSVISSNFIFPSYFSLLCKYTIISIDFKDDFIYYNGWLSKGPSIKNAIYNINNTILNKLIFTDISKDGTLTGVSFNSINYISSLLCSRKLFLFAGGVNSLSITSLQYISFSNFLGFISGKFIYYGK
ncbi:HisA/HisF-related TIM barrel protein [Candidatus Vidania fulgoroideorum]